MAEKKRHWLTITKVAILVTVQLCTPSALFAAPTSVTKTQDLNFGKVAGGSGYSGTITIGTSGARSSSGSVIPLGTVFSPARFTITGNVGKSYSLTLPAGFTISSGINQMNVSAITSSIPINGVIPAGGAVPFSVGGTLTVNSTQQSSTYSGTLTISVK
jgi:hypothetical protein